MPGRGRPFEKGHKLAKGGARAGAGAPTKEKMLQKESFRQALERMREEMAIELAVAYHDMALGKMNETATMRHLIDKVIPPVEKREHYGEVGVKLWQPDVDPQLLKKEKK
jgi:hypothetical protein